MEGETSARPVGRFAPTPSGRLHLGNLYCALLAWLSARKACGRFLLRIEDLDAARCPVESAQAILRELDAFGLDWDGEVPYQSERAAIYAVYAQELERQGLTYSCFCSRAELHAARAPHLSDGGAVYPGTCRQLTAEEIARRVEQGRRAAVRVRVPDTIVSFTDGVAGQVEQALAEECGDFIIRRSDGVYAYQLAVAVDDALSGVTEVVRGADLLSSTPRQIWLLERLSLNAPRYYHIPLLTDADGRRLSKRDGDTIEASLKRHTPREIVGALAFAAGLVPSYDPVSPQDLLPLFSWDALSSSPRLPAEFLVNT